MDNSSQQPTSNPPTSGSTQSGQSAGEHTLVQFPNTNDVQQATTPVQQPVIPSPVASQPLPTEPAVPIPSATSTASQMPQSVPSTPPQPVSPQQEEISTTKLKESLPMPSIIKNTEYIAPAEKPVNIESSVEQVGVKDVSQMPQLTDEHKKAGLKEAKESVPAAPIINNQTSNIKLPMTKQKALSIIKGPEFLQKASSSMIWLAYLIVKNYQFLEKKEKGEKNKK